jgi:hypothetical protein
MGNKEMKRISGLLALLACSSAAASAQMIAPNASVWVTPEMQAAKTLAESTARAPKDFLTWAESSGWKETGDYDECAEFYMRLSKSSPYARMVDIGATPRGFRMYVLVVSKDKAFDAASARATGKPILFLQNGIHPGENGGKDAAMMLLRDVLVTKKYAAWLDKVIILSMPVFNIDGHENRSPYNRVNEQGPKEMGFRVTANRYNLNRDYMKADSLEMQNWLKAFNKWNPDILIDNHVTDGQDQQPETTIAVSDTIDLHPGVASWVAKHWVSPLWNKMEADGHVMGWYVGGPARPGAPFVMAPSSPRFSTGYVNVRNRAALLVETHSLKPFLARAWGHFDIMKHTLDILAAQGTDLRAATSAADKDNLVGKPVALDYAPAKEGVPYTLKALETESYQGAALGGPVLRYLPKPRNFEVNLIRNAVPKTSVKAPKGYYIPREWQNVADLLRTHGVKVEVVKGSMDAEVEVARFDKVSFASQPFEGRFIPNFDVSFSAKKVRIPADTFYVPVAQPLGKLAMNLLEAQAPDSVVKWGTFNSIFEQKEYVSDYIMEPLAEKMLAADPKLKADFDAALAADPALAKSPRARLMWLYKRSPFYETDKDVYPVLRALP